MHARTLVFLVALLCPVAPGCNAATHAAVVKITDPVVRGLCAVYPSLRSQGAEVDTAGRVAPLGTAP
jgi:hypothetical protein